ncbi:MAG TPA: hypothetical protein PLV92_28690, partial [Pirellulaceae bacterium]|nr:hypothetical protein [Pirellulaceae bacterium]
MTSSNSENGADPARLRFPSYHELRWFLNDSEVERRLAMAGPNREPRVQVHPRRGPVDLLVERTLLPPDVDKLVASFRGAAIRGGDADGVIQLTSDATNGRPQTTPLAAPNGELIRLSQVFQSVELGVAPAHARAGECLVIPEDADPSRLVDLCDALAELPDWDARPLRVRDESKQEWTVFRLTPRSEWAAQLSWLRTSPTLLRAGGIRFDLFVPLGKRHPLDGNDRWLLPPLH